MLLSRLVPGFVFLAPLIMADRPAERDLRSVIRAETRLVFVPITVVDRRGAAVEGLTRDDLAVFEDNKLKDIVGLHAYDAPVSIGIVIDASESMHGRMNSAKQAVRTLIAALGSGDEAFLAGVSTHPENYADFDASVGTLQEKLIGVGPHGTTALYDTIVASLRHLRDAHNPRKALVVISDGMDNQSRYTRRELMQFAMEADAQIYTVVPGEDPGFRKALEMMQQRQGAAFLDELAQKTGGLHFTVRENSAIPAAVGRIGSVLRNQYVLTYRPGDTDDSGKWRKIRVKTNLPNTRVYWRSGYYTP